MTVEQIRRARHILDSIEELQRLMKEIGDGRFLPADATDEQVVEYLTKIIQHGYGSVLYQIARGVESEITKQIGEMEEMLKAL